MILILKDKENKIDLIARFNFIDLEVNDIYEVLDGMLVSCKFSLDSIEQHYIDKANEIKENRKFRQKLINKKTEE